ncbi:MAG: hypothetical protein JXR73_09015 [Candidatus Omnitrophica bacterium]|nr:hypothetical protein [Candidatus Omnitrophota bacterium]
MKTMGVIFVSIGFLACSASAVQNVQNVQWAVYGTAFLASVLGIVLIRQGESEVRQSTEVLSESSEILESSLRNIVEKISRLNADKESMDPHNVHREIDRLFVEDLDRFVQSRKSLTYLYGIQNYADVMSYFAAGERYLNRIWSASTDGYVDEVYAYLDQTQYQFEEALQKLLSLKDNQRD